MATAVYTGATVRLPPLDTPRDIMLDELTDYAAALCRREGVEFAALRRRLPPGEPYDTIAARLAPTERLTQPQPRRSWRLVCKAGRVVCRLLFAPEAVRVDGEWRRV
jgi:hypothetical protein